MTKATVICCFRKTDSADLNRTKDHYTEVFEEIDLNLFKEELERHRKLLHLEHCNYDGEIIVVHTMAVAIH